MMRRTAATLLLLVSVVTLAACSSSDNATKVDDSSTTTTEGDETTTTDEGLKSKIDLGGLESSSGDDITPDQEACVEDGVLADPTLSEYDSFESLQAGPQSDRELFFAIFVDCVGSDTVIDLFMTGFADSGSFTDEELDCVRGVVEAMSFDEGVSLLAGDTLVTETLTNDIAETCLLTG